jgi:hypothetical protein
MVVSGGSTRELARDARQPLVSGERLPQLTRPEESLWPSHPGVQARAEVAAAGATSSGG